MKQINYTLIVTFSMICLFSSFAHGMKRKAKDGSILIEDNILLIPLETSELIFRYLRSTPINVPLVQKSSISGILSFKIAPNGIVGRFAKMRSVCKHWCNVLSPVQIKKILEIPTCDIVDDLNKIKVMGNCKNYSHVQFLAQMVKNQINTEDKVCDHMLKNDPDKLKIFLENGLANPKYNNKLVFERRYNKITTCVSVLGCMLGFCFIYGCFYLLYQDSCMSGQWQTKDHPWKELINESLCNLCSDIQKDHEVFYPSLFVKDYFYRYYTRSCNVCNGTDFKSTMALYDQCIEGLFESCKNQCGIFNEVYGRWIRMGIEKWSNG